MYFSKLSIATSLLLASSAVAKIGNSSGKSDKRPWRGKSGKKMECTVESLAGKFRLDYDFFNGADNDYKFPDSYAALTITAPPGNGTGVMRVKYCFGGDNWSQMVAVQTGFERDGIIPIKIAKYEDRVDITKVHNEYSMAGEYDCETGKLILGMTGMFQKLSEIVDAPIFESNLS